MKSKNKSSSECEFQCPFEGCDRIFPTIRSLNGHQRAHSDKIGGRRFNCDFKDCKKSFTELYILNRHRKIHTNPKFKCSFQGCSKIFSNIKSWKAHEKRHLGFECEFKDCKQSFPTQHKFNLHQSVHTVPKFNCNFQDHPKIYSNIKRLEKHEKTILNPIPKPTMTTLLTQLEKTIKDRFESNFEECEKDLTKSNESVKSDNQNSNSYPLGEIYDQQDTGNTEEEELKSMWSSIIKSSPPDSNPSLQTITLTDDQNINSYSGSVIADPLTPNLPWSLEENISILDNPENNQQDTIEELKSICSLPITSIPLDFNFSFQANTLTDNQNSNSHLSQERYDITQPQSSEEDTNIYLAESENDQQDTENTSHNTSTPLDFNPSKDTEELKFPMHTSVAPTTSILLEMQYLQIAVSDQTHYEDLNILNMEIASEPTEPDEKYKQGSRPDKDFLKNNSSQLSFDLSANPLLRGLSRESTVESQSQLPDLETNILIDSLISDTSLNPEMETMHSRNSWSTSSADNQSNFQKNHNRFSLFCTKPTKLQKNLEIKSNDEVSQNKAKRSKMNFSLLGQSSSSHHTQELSTSYPKEKSIQKRKNRDQKNTCFTKKYRHK